MRLRSEQLVIFVRGEAECTREMRRGQSNIFGAIEEKGGGGFFRIFTDEEQDGRSIANGHERESFG